MENKMRIVFVFLASMGIMGCSSLDQSKWETNMQANTKLHVDRPQVVDCIDLSAGVKRSW
jgi:hypothetical protein